MKDTHKKHHNEAKHPKETSVPVSPEAVAAEITQQEPVVEPVVESVPAESAPEVLAETNESETIPPAAAEPQDGGKAASDEKYLRLLADFDNFRRRTVRERKDIYQRANEEIIEEMLPVIDHMELALKAAVEHKVDNAVLNGFRLVADQLLSAMKKSGVSPIDAEGAVFNPTLHEAIAHLPSPTVPENTVITQVRRGYMLSDRMLRAAQVVVSSGNPAKTMQEPSGVATEPGNTVNEEA